MEEELLLELEKAYSNGVPFEKIKEAVVAGGMDNQLSIVEDFYKKKKRTWHRTKAIRFGRFSIGFYIASNPR